MATVMSRDALLKHAPQPDKLPLYNASSERVFDATGADPMAGEVRWKASKSIWISTMTLGALILGPLTVTPGAFAVFLVTYLAGLCLGQTLGMHRLLIHRSYECPLWLERLFVYLGTIAGVQGPFSWIRNHDLRDWAQCQTECHPFLSQQGPIGRDYFWQTHCQLILEKPPRLAFEPRVANDPFYQFLERYFYLNQIPIALLLYALGGWPWVIWGMCARVAATVTGTWNMLYWAHNDGVQNWLVKGAGIQGYNVPYSSWMSMGEGWHNNHHAYPLSARFGMKDGEDDPGWMMLKALSKLGLVRDLQTPDTLPAAKELITVDAGPSPDVIVNPAPSACTSAGPLCRSANCFRNCGEGVPSGTAAPLPITY